MAGRHLLLTVFAPRFNATVELVCKKVLNVMHELCTDLRVPETEWPSTVEAIQLVNNNSPLRRLGGRSLIKIHTGTDSGNHLSVVLIVTYTRGMANVNKAELI